MRVRQTSIDAYNEIKENGLLEGLLLRVYDCLYHHGPLTQMEACRLINDPSVQDRSFMPRFAQLKDFGVIEETGFKDCSITGRNVLVWDVTENLPRKIEKKAEKRLWYGLFIRDLSAPHKLFKTKQAAVEYKLKNRIPGDIHQFEQIGK